MRRVTKRVAGIVAALAPVVALSALCFWPEAGAQTAAGQGWQFAVSGDSRNCGDVVMPMIAADVLKHHPQFYWQLGDFRAIYTFDEDILHQPEHLGHPMTILDYENSAWEDFITNQLLPFGDLPVFLGVGNHEFYPPKTRDELLEQFADWFNTPVIREQRERDNPRDHRMHIYYHWRERNVDFISLDNGTPDQFDLAQLRWVEGVLKKDEGDPEVATIVVGMHEALPDSISEDHSMSQSPAGIESGRRVYQDLLHAQNDGHKRMYVLASHSHYYMANIFNTSYLRSNGGVLPGWIIGTAGAVRYPLPPNAKDAAAAQTNVYGYLLANVQPDGLIDFQFHQLNESDKPAENVNRYKQEFVHWCFAENTQAK
jgi:hypothetical protein